MPTTKRLNHHSALIYIMVTIAAVDRSMTDDELGRIGQIVSDLPIFADYDDNLLVATAEECSKVVASDDGLHKMLTLVSEALPEALRETAYAIAVEIAAADQIVGQEELRFLELLSQRLKLTPLVTAAIERGARARYAVAI